jgi:hypothetical protein
MRETTSAQGSNAKGFVACEQRSWPRALKAPRTAWTKRAWGKVKEKEKTQVNEIEACYLMPSETVACCVIVIANARRARWMRVKIWRQMRSVVKRRFLATTAVVRGTRLQEIEWKKQGTSA